MILRLYIYIYIYIYIYTHHVILVLGVDLMGTINKATGKDAGTDVMLHEV